MREQELHIFLHIPKTGGSTLNSIFTRQFSAQELYDHEFFQNKIVPIADLTSEDRMQINAIAGHLLYGAHEQFTKPYHYFTMLRHPVDRVLSLYSYLRNYPGYERLQNMTLEEYVRTEPEAKNGQTLLLCGYPLQYNVSLAKKRLESFDVVGITERFDESLYLLKSAFGWTDIHYEKVNITKTRLKRTDVPLETIKLIEEHNKLDIELYHFAKELLQKRLKNLSKREKKAMKSFVQKQKSMNKQSKKAKPN
ncbi:hypothetical protein CEQ21_24845 [Niallia circulans]|uniref:Sulfotransferase n=1 Tax=Niallia circulans TaxID=1397 RepID=A0A553SNN7_NIACI|nr:sulfotransferase family 2 domain-containing protein [Niallia circulans]TRZ38610.1 hypothetical protein CEQ21_24845 [Niallia circulans]